MPTVCGKVVLVLLLSGMGWVTTGKCQPVAGLAAHKVYSNIDLLENLFIVYFLIRRGNVHSENYS